MPPRRRDGTYLPGHGSGNPGGFTKEQRERWAPKRENVRRKVEEARREGIELVCNFPHLWGLEKSSASQYRGMLSGIGSLGTALLAPSYEEQQLMGNVFSGLGQLGLSGPRWTPVDHNPFEH